MTDFCFWRDFDNLFMTKVVAVGYLCDDAEYNANGGALVPNWSKPNTLKPNITGQVIEFSGPLWTFCGESIAPSSLFFEFIDHNPLIASSLNDFISIDTASNTIKVVARAEAF